MPELEEIQKFITMLLGKSEKVKRYIAVDGLAPSEARDGKRGFRWRLWKIPYKAFLHWQYGGGSNRWVFNCGRAGAASR
ncbi:hypothetical protein SAMN05660235_02383 [Sporolituus thermophilus DSM 23256]|uniref:Uncharacterized protein n=1 Tax=Sporolituus thermophilus DSM 23256 TaxID=1123285 RepID=A0A1G7N1K6_9FIRM|nr:hypothetical protein SAMN05660235_02383 [Sporolituus thermophilus DSM 23256]